jgi:hypothetical protein
MDKQPKRTTTIRTAKAGRPGEAWVEIREFQKGDPAYQTTVNGKPASQGLSLADIRKDFGGKDEGYYQDVTGAQHFISLAAWKDANPDATYLNMRFYFKPDVYPQPGDPDYIAPPEREP